MNVIEPIADVVTGSVVARAIEQGSGEAGDGHTHESACLNCGAPLQGDYCHRCGQRAHVHRTLSAFFHDVAHGVLHFDGKIWRTLPMLAWKPGELTRRYVRGERSNFVSPMALFLFSVFLMFGVFGSVGGPFKVNTDVEDRAESAQEYQADRAEALKDIENLRQERRELAAAGENTVGVDTQLKVAENALALVERLRADELRRDQQQVARERQQTVSVGETTTGKKAELRIGRTGIQAIDHALEKAESNPELLLYKVQNNAYKYSWALIPISVPFVWLLFLHRRRYRQFRGYDHTVFVTYSIAFMTLGLITLSLFRWLGLSEAIIGLAIFFVPPLHMYRQLRGAYELSRWSAVWRTFALLLFATIASALFLSLLVAMGALG